LSNEKKHEGAPEAELSDNQLAEVSGGTIVENSKNIRSVPHSGSTFLGGPDTSPIPNDGLSLLGGLGAGPIPNDG
jgi:bacteriocin-like protein